MADPTRVQGYCRHVTAHHCNVTSHHTGVLGVTSPLPLCYPWKPPRMTLWPKEPPNWSRTPERCGKGKRRRHPPSDRPFRPLLLSLGRMIETEATGSLEL
jgi:hypothetical protein